MQRPKSVLENGLLHNAEVYASAVVIRDMSNFITLFKLLMAESTMMTIWCFYARSATPTHTASKRKNTSIPKEKIGAHHEAIMD